MKTKKEVLLSLVLSISIISQSQISKTISCTAGNLEALLGGSKTVVTNLTITGSIDARDFKCMGSIMTSLLYLDINAVTIKSYTGPNGTTVGSYNVYQSNEIPSNSFTMNSNSRLYSIILPNSLTSIAASAFWNNYRLGIVSIPNSVTSIGQLAFEVTGITNIILPTGLTTLGWGAFSNCNIKQITIPNTVTNFGVNIGSDYGYHRGVFMDCKSLESISIPNSITNIPENTFKNCIALKNITIPNSISYILYNAFENCTSLTDIIIPNSVTSIGSNAFLNCKGLKSIVIGSKVSNISDLAFDGCTSLSSITVSSKTPLDFTNTRNVFRGVNKSTCILNVPIGTKSDYQTNIVWMDFKNIIESTTDISSPTIPSITFLPNPNTESFTINGLLEFATMILFDLNGKIVFTKHINNAEPISISNLQNGIYIAKVVTKNATYQHKLIKQ
jgi:hypothetical protein